MNDISSNRRVFLQGSAAAALAVAERTGAAIDVPAGACDCHVHVFEPDSFPYTLPRTYTPGEAAVPALLALEKSLGIDRVVLVQPSSYGTDNKCLLSALERIGTHRATGIAVINPSTVERSELERWHASGVRGVRLNVEVKGEVNLETVSAALQRTAALIAPLGWVVQLYADVAMVAALSGVLAALPCPVILDHFGGLKAKEGLQPSGLPALLGLLDAGNIYLKLSAPYRVSRSGPAFDDVAPFARVLIQAAPERMIWGTDWPHTGSSGQRNGDLGVIESFRHEDDLRTLGLLLQWAPDARVRHKILVENPVSLFGLMA